MSVMAVEKPAHRLSVEWAPPTATRRYQAYVVLVCSCGHASEPWRPERDLLEEKVAEHRIAVLLAEQEAVGNTIGPLDHHLVAGAAADLSPDEFDALRGPARWRSIEDTRPL